MSWWREKSKAVDCEEKRNMAKSAREKREEKERKKSRLEAEKRLELRYNDDCKRGEERVKEIDAKRAKIMEEFSLDNIITIQNEWGKWLTVSYFNVDVFLGGIVDITSQAGREAGMFYQTYQELIEDSMCHIYRGRDVPVPEVFTSIIFELSTGRTGYFGVPVEIGEVVFEKVKTIWKENRK